MAYKKSQEAADSLREKLDDIKGKLADIEGNFEKKIEEHPLQSIAVAFGAGVVAGAVLVAVLKRNK
ncbi:MAG: hypothetical protein GY861_14880 [bacterium]|nr:hypothetical protein [bacterium]